MNVKAVFLTVLLVFAVTGAALADDDAEIRKLPGYVDFEALELFGDTEAKIEVYLKDPLLNLVAKFVQYEDEELYDILSKLKLVRVQVFDVDVDLAREIAEISKKTTQRLDKKGWERVVRVREDEEHIDVYLKPSDDFELLQGIVILVVSEDGEAIFVNIVGDIKPDDIGRLGHHFDIEELDSIRYETRERHKRN